MRGLRRLLPLLVLLPLALPGVSQARIYTSPSIPSGTNASNFARTGWFEQNPDSTYSYYTMSNSSTPVRQYTYPANWYQQLIARERGMLVELGSTSATAASTAPSGMSSASIDASVSYANDLRGRPVVPPYVAGESGYRSVLRRVFQQGRRAQYALGVMPKLSTALGLLGRVSLAATALQAGLYIGGKVDEVFGLPRFGSDGTGGTYYCKGGSACPSTIAPATSADTWDGTSEHLPDGTVARWEWYFAGAGGYIPYRTSGSGCPDDPQPPPNLTPVPLTAKPRCGLDTVGYVLTEDNVDIEGLGKGHTHSGLTTMSAPGAPSAATVAGADLGVRHKDLDIYVMGKSGNDLAPVDPPELGSDLPATPEDPSVSLGTVPACTGSWTTCSAAMTSAGFTNVTRTTRTTATADLTKPAGNVLDVNYSAGTRLETGTAITVDTNPDTGSYPLVVPNWVTTDRTTVATYTALLTALGLVTDVTTRDSSNPNLDYGPSEVTKSPSPAPGTRVLPGTHVAVEANPADAPTPAGIVTPPSTGCGLTAPAASITLNGLDGLNPGSRIPFSLVPWVASTLSSVSSSGARPNLTFSLLGATVDWSWLSHLDTVFTLLRTLLAVFLWIGVAWWLWSQTLGKG